MSRKGKNHNPTIQEKIICIEKLLPTGRKNAVSKETLSLNTGLSERELMRRIHNERCEGALICSLSTGGYFKPETREEIEDFISSMEKRAINCLKVVSRGRRELKWLDTQKESKLCNKDNMQLSLDLLEESAEKEND